MLKDIGKLQHDVINFEFVCNMHFNLHHLYAVSADAYGYKLPQAIVPLETRNFCLSLRTIEFDQVSILYAFPSFRDAFFL